MLQNEFESEYCSVQYIEKDNVVLLTWKKFCCFEDYRQPTMFASDLLNRYQNSNFIIDARNGFEDDKSDVEWGFSVLLPAMAKSDCKICIFIMSEIADIDDEIDLWSKEFRKYFLVKKVLGYEDAIKLVQKESIQNTRKGFEESFETGEFYNKQTQDTEHLESILNCLKIHEGMKILDLGTGTGYLAFPITEKYPDVELIGLDIVDKTLEKNRKKAESEGLENLHFVSYNGLVFPFGANTFDLIITRYALHHFPAIQDTFQEISRVLKHNGTLFLSDPTPNEDDTERFVDAYMQMKKDGHIKFYTKTEWKEIAASAGLNYVDGFETHIRFPKKKQTAHGFQDIMNQFDKQVIKGYEVEIMEEEIWITERVNNLLFQKKY